MQILLNGTVNGLMIAALALAFSLVYLPTGVFHLALAGVYSIAPYLAWMCKSVGFGWPISIVIAVVASGFLSLAVELLTHRRLERKGASPTSHMVSSLGAYIVLTQTAASIWTNDPQTLRQTADSVVRFGSLQMTISQCVEAFCGILVLTLCLTFLGFTKTGLQLRALAENPVLMMTNGYPIWRLRKYAFLLSGMMAGVVAICAAFDYGFEPNGGLQTLLLAAVAVMIGGRGSFVAPIAGAIGLGILRAEVDWQLSARWQDPLTFAILAGVLLFRPFGIFASARRLEAQ